jgi:hypothetical protein
MKRKSSASLTARVTLGAVLSLTGIALLCVLPANNSYADKAKRNARSGIRQNAQTLNINLVGVSGGGNSGNVSVPMAVLLGDTNADRFCDAIDVSQTKSQSGNPVGLTNFREDVNADGFTALP